MNQSPKPLQSPYPVPDGVLIREGPSIPFGPWNGRQAPPAPSHVEDVISGMTYSRIDSSISRESYNAMETIAWIAQDELPGEPAGNS